MYYRPAEALGDTQQCLWHCFNLLCGEERAFPVQPGENTFVSFRQSMTDNRDERLN